MPAIIPNKENTYVNNFEILLFNKIYKQLHNVYGTSTTSKNSSQRNNLILIEPKHRLNNNPLYLIKQNNIFLTNQVSPFESYNSTGYNIQSSKNPSKTISKNLSNENNIRHSKTRSLNTSIPNIKEIKILQINKCNITYYLQKKVFKNIHIIDNYLYNLPILYNIKTWSFNDFTLMIDLNNLSIIGDLFINNTPIKCLVNKKQIDVYKCDKYPSVCNGYKIKINSISSDMTFLSIKSDSDSKVISSKNMECSMNVIIDLKNVFNKHLELSNKIIENVIHDINQIGYDTKISDKDTSNQSSENVSENKIQNSLLLEDLSDSEMSEANTMRQINDNNNNHLQEDEQLLLYNKLLIIQENNINSSDSDNINLLVESHESQDSKSKKKFHVVSLEKQVSFDSQDPNDSNSILPFIISPKLTENTVELPLTEIISIESRQLSKGLFSSKDSNHKYVDISNGTEYENILYEFSNELVDKIISDAHYFMNVRNSESTGVLSFYSSKATELEIEYFTLSLLHAMVEKMVINYTDHFINHIAIESYLLRVKKVAFESELNSATNKIILSYIEFALVLYTFDLLNGNIIELEIVVDDTNSMSHYFSALECSGFSHFNSNKSKDVYTDKYLFTTFHSLCPQSYNNQLQLITNNHKVNAGELTKNIYNFLNKLSTEKKVNYSDDEHKFYFDYIKSFIINLNNKIKSKENIEIKIQYGREIILHFFKFYTNSNKNVEFFYINYNNILDFVKYVIKHSYLIKSSDTDLIKLKHYDVRINSYHHLLQSSPLFKDKLYKLMNGNMDLLDFFKDLLTISLYNYELVKSSSTEQSITSIKTDSDCIFSSYADAVILNSTKLNVHKKHHKSIVYKKQQDTIKKDKKLTLKKDKIPTIKLPNEKSNTNKCFKDVFKEYILENNKPVNEVRYTPYIAKNDYLMKYMNDYKIRSSSNNSPEFNCTKKNCIKYLSVKKNKNTNNDDIKADGVRKKSHQNDRDTMAGIPSIYDSEVKIQWHVRLRALCRKICCSCCSSIED